jgi:sugar/nucleoside kinase (ribokinase family)
MPDFDLLVIGEINPDLILRGADIAPAFGQAEKLVEDAVLTIGSSSVIMACGAARLGLRTAFIGLVGEDEFGRFMLRSMRERGIDTSACVVDATQRTGMSVILSRPDDRAILTYSGAIGALCAAQIDDDVLRHASHLHVGSYFLLDALRPDLPALLNHAHSLGLTTSLDTNWDPSGKWDGGLDRMLDACDLFLPNEAEALLIARCESLDDAAARLSEQVPTLAIKQGARGARAWQEGNTAQAPSLQVPVVDTTGAGDSFDAGFLYGYLEGWPLGQALRLACACGSLSTRYPGGTDGQPTLDEALAGVEGS